MPMDFDPNVTQDAVWPATERKQRECEPAKGGKTNSHVVECKHLHTVPLFTFLSQSADLLHSSSRAFHSRRIKTRVLDAEGSIKTSNSMKRFLYYVRTISVIWNPVSCSYYRDAYSMPFNSEIRLSYSLLVTTLETSQEIRIFYSLPIYSCRIHTRISDTVVNPSWHIDMAGVTGCCDGDRLSVRQSCRVRAVAKRSSSCYKIQNYKRHVHFDITWFTSLRCTTNSLVCIHCDSQVSWRASLFVCGSFNGAAQTVYSEELYDQRIQERSKRERGRSWPIWGNILQLSWTNWE